MRRSGKHHIRPTTAMIADINGISMGQRDDLLTHGVEFLYTNIHCHHGMYPLYQNQTAYWWENTQGKRLLVWNGEHYHMGNAMGVKSQPAANSMTEGTCSATVRTRRIRVDTLHQNVDGYLTLCEENGYRYDFIVPSVSGVFSDNAPPEPKFSGSLRT